MGVAGSGKTTVGKALHTILGWPFLEGDDLHPEKNRKKMAAFEPLTDEDRAPWLAAIAQAMRDALEKNRPLIVSCSALKASYRKTLLFSPNIKLVYLQSARGVILQRVSKRRGHFFPKQLVASQFATLEPPSDALTLQSNRPPRELALLICAKLGL